ncbi:hypothetical protein [Burkholderia sp. Bp9142]|uniref:hypothetical protein n=1 Tax=Burkholderia sp. Bp9142 TaxID=2184573 RepID=UPI000F595BC0|nr:hypothetical protein [Burkholderia sp. Bp9142]
MNLMPPVVPPPIPRSVMGYRYPSMRAAQLPGMVSVAVRDLFPDLPVPLMVLGDSAEKVREATVSALESVDLSRIGANDSVNILCSEHGFAMMGGDAYVATVCAVKDEVERRTGNRKLRLAFSSATSKFEGKEIIEHYKLDEYFEGRVVQFGPYEKGVEIETEIGLLYGIGLAYKAQHIIYVHYDDPRETHFHRLNGRALKAFTMSYARIETRGIFHNNFPTSSANIVPRALYESPFIQEKFVCAVMLRSSPSGIMGVDADRDLIALDKRMTRELLRDFGKMIHLFESIDSCIAVMDGHRWLHYQHAGGLTSCNLFFGPDDHLDLEIDTKSPGNPAVKAVVLNYAWKSAFTLKNTPFIAADPRIANSLRKQGLHYEVHSADSLEQAMEQAHDLTGTRKAIIFDGSYGAINCSREMAEALLHDAPQVTKTVDEVLMPKWLKQRRLA